MLVIALLPLALGCKASVKAEAKTQARMGDNEEPMSTPPPEEVDVGDQEPSGGFAGDTMVGARHDLQLAEDTREATCNCLAVAVGQPTDPRFFWQAGPPTTGADQLVIAFTSDGVACSDASEDSVGASYWGHKKDGENIVVVIEEAQFGRPVTSGAIIPRPGPTGAVYVQPVSARVPYGRPLSAGDRYCRVGDRGPTQ